MTKDEALRLALEALELAHPRFGIATEKHKQAISAIKATLEAKDEKANDELRRLHDLLGKANALARIRANKIDELEQRLTKTEAQLGEAVWNYGELKREQLANQQKTSGSPINTSTALEAKDEPHKWKLVPIEPTDEMLKAMDECSIEGYDERLYAGYAASVYMAAVDVAPSPSQQHAEDIAKLGWQYFECPACGSEGARAFPKQEAKDEPVPVAIVEVFGKDWRLDYMALPVGKHKLYAQQYTYTTPSQRKPLTDEEIEDFAANTLCVYSFARAIETKLKDKNT